MNRQEKEAVVAQFKEMFGQSEAAFLVNYKGVTVDGLQTLRRGLRENNGVMKVTKARLMKIAAENIDGVDDFKQDFKDQVGLVFAMGEVPAVAKALIDFSKDSESFNIISGFFESKALTSDQVKYLASLPSREVLLAQVAGTLQAPVSTFARLLQMMMIRLLFVLKQVAETKEG